MDHLGEQLVAILTAGSEEPGLPPICLFSHTVSSRTELPRCPMTMTPPGGIPRRRFLGWAFQHVVGDYSSWSTDVAIPLADFATAEASLNGYQAWAGGVGWAGILEYITEDHDTGKLKAVPAAGAQSGGYYGLAPYVADKNIHQVTIGLSWYADPGERTDVGAWYSIWTFDVPLFL